MSEQEAHDVLKLEIDYLKRDMKEIKDSHSIQLKEIDDKCREMSTKFTEMSTKVFTGVSIVGAIVAVIAQII